MGNHLDKILIIKLLNMPTLEFDAKFQKLTTEIVEIAFEFINYNDEEVDIIFVYGSMENLNPFFNLFYKINGTLIELHKINSVLKKQCDASSDKMFDLLDLGVEYLEKIAELF